MSSQGVARGDATPRTYARLREDIVSGLLPVGEPLLEDRVADRYGVSRTPVREALRRLEQDGLVERAPRGFRIRRFRPDEVFDIYEARILLEGHAARCAAERHRSVDALRLREAHHRMAQLSDAASRSDRVAANQDFHRVIWESAGNHAILELLTRLYLQMVRHTTLNDPARWSQAIAEHAVLLEAILERRADDAAGAMAGHIASGRDLILARQAQDPDRLG